MRRTGRREIISLVAGLLLAISQACNLPISTGPGTSTPEAPTTVVTATNPGLTPEPTEEATKAIETSITGQPTLSLEGDIFASVSIKDGNATYQGKISFPGNDSSDEISIKPVGFDSTVTSGTLVFQLTCSGEKKAKVNYKGGAVKSGSPGCGETWTVAVATGSADSQITIRLDDSGEVDWTLSVASGD